MDRTAFEFLYLNANSIAELAFVRSMHAMLAAPAQRDGEAQAELAAFGERIATMTPETFDWSAFEGVTGFDPQADAATAAHANGAAPAADVDDASELPRFGDVVDLDDDEGPAEAAPDVARYLARVAAARPRLQAQVDDCLRRADVAAIDAALAAAPVGLPPITGPLAAEAFAHWLALYEAEDAGVRAAVLEIRRLEPLF